MVVAIVFAVTGAGTTIVVCRHEWWPLSLWSRSLGLVEVAGVVRGDCVRSDGGGLPPVLVVDRAGTGSVGASSRQCC